MSNDMKKAALQAALDNLETVCNLISEGPDKLELYLHQAQLNAFHASRIISEHLQEETTGMRVTIIPA